MIINQLAAPTLVAIVATMIALLVALGIAVGIVAAFVAWRDWQRERASWNIEPGRSHRLGGVGQHPKPLPTRRQP
jgi:uncharacterized membrane protein YccC